MRLKRAWSFPRGRSLVSRLFVALLPILIIVIFWAMARYEARTARDSASRSFVQRNGWGLSVFFVGAVGFWILFMIVLPQLYMIQESFHPKLPPTKRGGPEDVLTLEHYRFFIFGLQSGDQLTFNVTHLKAFVLTIVISLVVTIINFAICYPLAFYLAQVGTAQKVRVLMLALIVPFWVNEILRAFAFRVLLGSGGLINRFLIALGIVPEDAPIDFLGNNIGLYVGLSYAYLLTMVFPLYNAIESLDRNQIEAARDLGAPWWRIHKDVVMPFAKPGIASGCTMVFMLSAGALAAPQFLGGPNTLWFTSIVYDFFFQAFNWPRGAAYAFILLIACILFVLAVLRLFKVSLGEITR
jgi:spermidine/putrescine transport system permease protein